ncbi:MAG: hypothetical protein KAU50_04100, partial [Candidatus Marinimicrobia bacterium]|nr:hypothetical protein [Candidatus Neomarinimicrobiota bacterium]
QALAASLRDDTLFQQCGRFVDEDLAQQLDIPWGDRRYGDLLWVANQGVLVFPDFFHRDTPYRAMHGYIPEDSPDNLGACIVMGAGVPQRQVDQVPLGEVYHILRRSVLGE